MRNRILGVLSLLLLSAPARAQSIDLECFDCAAAPQPQLAPRYAPPSYVPQPLYAPQPVGPRMTSEPRWGLIVAGAAVFLSMYAPTAIGGYIGGNGWAALPVFGPVGLAVDAHSRDQRGEAALWALDGLVQSAGVAMLIAGVASRKQLLVYDRVALAPAVSSTFAGVAASGRF